MNNLKKFKSLLLILFLVSCQKNNIEKTIATYTIPFNELNDSTFETYPPDQPHLSYPKLR